MSTSSECHDGYGQQVQGNPKGGSSQKLQIPRAAQNVPNSAKSSYKRSFGQFSKLGMGLKVDLSESEMKISEERCAPLSCRAGGVNALAKESDGKPSQDLTISRQKYAVTTCQGNFRRTQEDRFIACDDYNSQQIPQQSPQHIPQQSPQQISQQIPQQIPQQTTTVSRGYQLSVGDDFDGNPMNGFFGVFDGHQGEKAAEYCRTHILRKLVQRSQLLNRNTQQAIKEVFGELDSEFLQVARQNEYPDGTTCLIALILKNKLTIANLGDSSAILIRNNQMLELTSEQTPTRIDEYQRITSQQGVVVQVGNAMRVEGVLAVSRAIGDIHFKQYIISEPELGTIQIMPQDQYLIISSDGLFKQYSKQYVSQQVIQLRREGLTLGQISQKISLKAVEQGCPDNITLIIVDLQEYYKQFMEQKQIENHQLNLAWNYIGSSPKKEDKDGFAVPMPVKTSTHHQRKSSSLMSLKDCLVGRDQRESFKKSERKLSAEHLWQLRHKYDANQYCLSDWTCMEREDSPMEDDFDIEFDLTPVKEKQDYEESPFKDAMDMRN